LHSDAQLIRRSVVPPEVRRQQKQIHPKIQLMRQPPCRDLANVVERSHAAVSCNRAAHASFANSGENPRDTRIEDAQIAASVAIDDCNFCNRRRDAARRRAVHTPNAAVAD
jgi:hypothetical protein